MPDYLQQARDIQEQARGEDNPRLLYGHFKRLFELHEQAVGRIEALEAELRATDCPRPANGRPDDRRTPLPSPEGADALLREALRELLNCPDIADNDDKDEETHVAERKARFALSLPAPQDASPAQVSGEAWRYSINYGPDGEQNYAMVYDSHGGLVGNLRTHHAIAVCNAIELSNRLAAATLSAQDAPSASLAGGSS